MVMGITAEMAPVSYCPVGMCRVGQEVDLNFDQADAKYFSYCCKLPPGRVTRISLQKVGNGSTKLAKRRI